MSKGFHVPDYGVEIWEGLMGSGKSYMATRKVLDFIIQERRPVFTNLPLKWRVVRQYLKNRGIEKGIDAQAFANLIQPLDEEHFRAFIIRQHKKFKEREKYASECRRNGHNIRMTTFNKYWEQNYGKDRWRREIDPETGEVLSANWVLPMSLIVIDEGHNWFPNTSLPGMKSMQGKEIPELLFYLAMIRHHLHWLWIISQRREQVSKRFRDLAQRFTIVRQRGNDPIAWGLRFGHVGLKAFAYVTMTPDQEAALGGKESKPLSDETVFYWLPKHRWYFRLYDSFTHMGGVRRMRNAIKEVREAVGLHASGEAKIIEVEQSKNKDDVNMKWILRIVLLMLAFILGVVLSGSLVAKSMGEAVVAEMTRKLPEIMNRPEIVDDLPPADETPYQEYMRGIDKWKSFSSKSVKMGNKIVKIGGEYHGGYLLGVDVETHTAYWIIGNDIYGWMWSKPEPNRISSVEEFKGYAAGLQTKNDFSIGGTGQ